MGLGEGRCGLIGATALKSSTAEVVMRNYYAQLWKHISDILERAQAKDELDRDININHFMDRR